MKILAALIFAMSLACGGTLPRVKYYDLSRIPQPESHVSSTGPILTLEDVRAAPGLDSDQIAIRSLRGNIQHYLYHRWHAPLPLLAMELVGQVFASSGHFRRVDLHQTLQDSDLLVTARILRFEGIRQRAAPTIARVAMEFTVRSSTTGTTLMTGLYTRDLPVTEHSVDALANALRDGVQSIAKQAAREAAASSP